MFAVDMDFFAGAPLPSFLSEAAWTEVELASLNLYGGMNRTWKFRYNL